MHAAQHAAATTAQQAQQAAADAVHAAHHAAAATADQVKQAAADVVHAAQHAASKAQHAAGEAAHSAAERVQHAVPSAAHAAAASADLVLASAQRTMYSTVGLHQAIARSLGLGATLKPAASPPASTPSTAQRKGKPWLARAAALLTAPGRWLIGEPAPARIVTFPTFYLY
jgi:hypothetical protein